MELGKMYVCGPTPKFKQFSIIIANWPMNNCVFNFLFWVTVHWQAEGNFRLEFVVPRHRISRWGTVLKRVNEFCVCVHRTSCFVSSTCSVCTPESSEGVRNMVQQNQSLSVVWYLLAGGSTVSKNIMHKLRRNRLRMNMCFRMALWNNYSIDLNRMKFIPRLETSWWL